MIKTVGPKVHHTHRWFSHLPLAKATERHLSTPVFRLTEATLLDEADEESFKRALPRQIQERLTVWGSLATKTDPRRRRATKSTKISDFRPSHIVAYCESPNPPRSPSSTIALCCPLIWSNSIKSDLGGDRTRNLLIRSQTLYL